MISRILLGHGFTAELLGKRVAFYRWARATAFLALTVLSAAAGWAADQAAGPDELSARLLTLVNAERAKAGQPALAFEARLNAAACLHARDLARGGPLSHRGSEGRISPGAWCAAAIPSPWRRRT